MSKIKIGAQVTAKVRPTKVTVSGTFQRYRKRAEYYKLKINEA